MRELRRSPTVRLVGALVAAVLLYAMAAPAAQARRTYFTEFNGDPGWQEGLRQRPAAIHGGSDFGWWRIHWFSWDGRRAVARSQAYLKDKSFVPFRRIVWPARLVMDARGECFGRLIYRRLTIINGRSRPRGVSRIIKIPFPCSDATAF